MKAVTNDTAAVIAITFVLLVVACTVWMVHDSLRRRRAEMRDALRPALVWDPQCQANVRAFWRNASGTVLDHQPAVRDALAILRDAEERLKDYGDRQPRDT